VKVRVIENDERVSSMLFHQQKVKVIEDDEWISMLFHQQVKVSEGQGHRGPRVGVHFLSRIL
jgi:hypothetical protein